MPFEAMCEVKALAYAMKDELLKGNLHSFGKLAGLWLAEQKAHEQQDHQPADRRALRRGHQVPALWAASFLAPAAAVIF